jgi:hypothetical protein
MRVARLLMVLSLVLGALVTPAAAADRAPRVVVAVADTGVNPYHEVYYRPQNTAHPCTWVEGFDDCSIPALDLSIGAFDSYAEAVAADQALWDSVEPHQWYCIPKTNIIGAVCDVAGSVSGPVGVCILDDQAHGTGTTSSVLSEAPDALLLVHDGNSSAVNLESAPVIPDIQSHSWGPAAPLPLHAADPLLPGASVFCDDGAFDDETIFFVSAGNEVPWPTVADCSRVDNRVQIVGGGYPGKFQSNSWTLYDFASWYCRPTASYTSITDTYDYCGTSFSAPTAAGAAAAALLRIRQQEGYVGGSTPQLVSTSVTRDAFIEAMRTAATYTPAAKFPNTGGAAALPLPAQAPYLVWGYGWLDSTVSEAIASCALGGTCPQKSAEANEHNARRRAVRSATYDDAVPSEPQDDAGSGRDAGTARSTAVPVTTTGLTYTARLDGYALSGDIEDWFTFDGAPGQTLDVSVSGSLGCWEVFDPTGALLASGCSSGVQDLATTTAGQYVFTYGYFTPPQEYSFTLTADGSVM